MRRRDHAAHRAHAWPPAHRPIRARQIQHRVILLARAAMIPFNLARGNRFSTDTKIESSMARSDAML
jgi:hypothetical protein